MSAAAARAAARSRPRLGFAGLGWIGRRRLRSIAAADTAEIAALVDPIDTCIEGAREVAPSAAVVEHFEDLLSLGLDGIVIATPNALHLPQVHAALEAECAVFCQKPLAHDATATRGLVEAARAADRDLSVDLSYRHVRAMRRVRDLVRDGAIGDVFAVELVFHNAYGPDKAWFYDPRLSGGGCVLDLGIHLVDLALWTLGFPAVEAVESQLFQAGRRLGPGLLAAEDFALARIDFAGDITARLACSWRLSAGCDAQIEVSFYGTAGRATLRNRGGSFYDFSAERACGTALETLDDGPDDWGGGAALAWIARLGAGGRYCADTDALIVVAEVLDAIYRRHGVRGAA
ncbi:MAG: Gfo/Idh/MocA family protein [Candidatus Binatia bacterium]